MPITGIRVQIPFGKGTRFGLVLAVAEESSEVSSELKQVSYRVDVEALFDPARLLWLNRVARYYLASPGGLWSTSLGWALEDDLRRFRAPEPDRLDDAGLKGLFTTRAAITLKTVLKRAADTGEVSGVRYALSKAVTAGLVEAVSAKPFQSAVVDAEVAEYVATPDQQRAIDAIVGHLDTFQPYLLFGCTGSGKTEVYLKAAESVVAKGGQVLVLVPEIGLTPMWLSRLTHRFKHVSFWHSALSAGDRLSVRQHLDTADVLIGTRSALFLPLPRLSMIVVDEEHDVSFKQQEGMAYSARDMAVLLAQELNIPIVLGSATPSLESWAQVEAGRYQRLDLPLRVASHDSPMRSEIVDMRGVDAPLSTPLLTALRDNRARWHQSTLFRNRRGYAPPLPCATCRA